MESKKSFYKNKIIMSVILFLCGLVVYCFLVDIHRKNTVKAVQEHCDSYFSEFYENETRIQVQYYKKCIVRGERASVIAVASIMDHQENYSVRDIAIDVVKKNNAWEIEYNSYNGAGEADGQE